MRLRGEDGSLNTFVCTGNTICIVYDQASSKESGVSQHLQECVQMLHSAQAQKVFVMSGGYTDFQKRFPFLCLTSQSTAEEIGAARLPWPCEIAPGRLYLGSTANAAASQCDSLSIGTVIDLSESGAKVMAPAAHVHLPVPPDPEARIPILEALAALNDADGAVLVCCEDGVTQSPAVAIAHIMSSTKLQHLQALTFVMKRKRDIHPSAMAYVQLQELEAELLCGKR